MNTIKLIPFLLFLLLLSCKQPEKTGSGDQHPDTPTVFYFIRHAEKDRSDAEERNPELTPEGRARAMYWKDVLSEVPLQAVYSTDYKRTKQTAQPVADAKKLPLSIYSDGKAQVKDWAQKHQGQHILVVGHSNTIPGIVNEFLGTEKYDQIEDNNNANLYIVTLTGQQAGSILLQPDLKDRNHMEQQ